MFHFRQRVVQGNVRRPGGRTLSQEDLEAYGLSIEVSSDFGLQTSHKVSPQPQPFSPSLRFVSPVAETVTSITSIQPNKQVTPTSQFCRAPGKPQQAQFVDGALPSALSSPQYSQQNPRPAANNLPFRSQFSPPNTINSKQPFQF